MPTRFAHRLVLHFTGQRSRAFRQCLWVGLITAGLISGLVSPRLNASECVIIVVIDGARWHDTFGAAGAYIPRMWNDLRTQGTYYTNFYNLGETSTMHGHANLLTGVWHYINDISNDGLQRPAKPTIFEYYRKAHTVEATKTYLVTGKNKLHILNYSNHADYGSAYQASFSAADRHDAATWVTASNIMDNYQPNLLFINLRDVDSCGHNYGLTSYRQAIRGADSLVYLLWQKVQSSAYYRDHTTLFVTSDHGMHKMASGPWMTHGDECLCDSCSHIFLFAIGRRVAPGQVLTDQRTQRDLAATVGDLLSCPTPYSEGVSLYQGDQSLPVILSRIELKYTGCGISVLWETATEIENSGFIIEKLTTGNYREIASYTATPGLVGLGSSSVGRVYNYTDTDIQPHRQYSYRILSVSYQGERAIVAQRSITTPANSHDLPASPVLQVTPNPVTRALCIRFAPVVPGPVRITIYNLAGHPVKSYRIFPNSPSLYFELAFLSDLSTGIYFVEVRNGATQIRTKCLLLK